MGFCPSFAFVNISVINVLYGIFHRVFVFLYRFVCKYRLCTCFYYFRYRRSFLLRYKLAAYFLAALVCHFVNSQNNAADAFPLCNPLILVHIAIGHRLRFKRHAFPLCYVVCTDYRLCSDKYFLVFRFAQNLFLAVLNKKLSVRIITRFCYLQKTVPAVFQNVTHVLIFIVRIDIFRFARNFFYRRGLFRLKRRLRRAFRRSRIGQNVFFLCFCKRSLNSRRCSRRCCLCRQSTYVSFGQLSVVAFGVGSLLCA